jgi:TldD protein
MNSQPVGWMLLLVGLVSCATPGPEPAAPAAAPAAPTVAAPAKLPALRVVTADKSPNAEPSPLLRAMTEELQRNMRELSEKGPQKPYYLSYEVFDEDQADLGATRGALREDSSSRSRSLEVGLRVGDRHLDNTHETRTQESVTAPFMHAASPFPIDADADAARAALWVATDRHYKDAVRRIDTVRANRAVKASEEDVADDFSEEAPQHYVDTPRTLTLDRPAWVARLRKWSAAFRDHLEIYSSGVQLVASAENKYFVSSEGTQILSGEVKARLIIQGQTRAEDGEVLRRVETFDASSFDRLPNDEEVLRKVAKVSDDLIALRRAPTMDPFTGPAILEGKAAGVFFHETLGHRLEGQRQKRDVEGQTFAKKRGERVMPELINVFDDPRIAGTDALDFNGHYLFDDEGVPAQRASLIESGVLRTFLMSRSPTHGVTQSNGHGRRAAGFPLVARQGNLFVAPSSSVPVAELRRMLLDEVKRQGKPFGLVFRELEGGFTNTSRLTFQAFKVLPVMVYRVYLDGRPDELVRGADIVGTPLATLSEIMAAGDDYATFNGICGAESGPVPVSATSPSLLVRDIEVSRKFKGDERPPVLPPPPELPTAGGAP